MVIYIATREEFLQHVRKQRIEEEVREAGRSPGQIERELDTVLILYFSAPGSEELPATP